MDSILVLGAGKIGRTVSHLLAQGGAYQVRVADADKAAADSTTAGLPRATPLQFSFDDRAALDDALAGARAAISCAPYHQNLLIAERARAAGVHYFDLTEDVAVARKVQELAKDATTAFMPQCGLAPGFIAIAAHHLVEGMSEIHDLRLRVGALPRYSSNRLHYNLTWSTEGLINEYSNPCDALVEGEPVTVPPLAQREEFLLDGVAYEAFNTSGGVGSLAATLRGRARNLSYKTIRFPGHCEVMKLLLHDLRFREHRAELVRILDRAIPTTLQDQVVVYITAVGLLDGKLTERSFARTYFAQEIGGKTFSAIQVTTAAGVCGVVDLMLTGKLPGKGVVQQEQVPLPAFLANRFGRHYA